MISAEKSKKKIEMKKSNKKEKKNKMIKWLLSQLTPCTIVSSLAQLCSAALQRKSNQSQSLSDVKHSHDLKTKTKIQYPFSYKFTTWDYKSSQKGF